MTFLNVAFQASELHSSVDVAVSENQSKISFTRIRNAWSGYLDQPSSWELGLRVALGMVFMLPDLRGAGLDTIDDTSTICSALFRTIHTTYVLIPDSLRLCVV